MTPVSYGGSGMTPFRMKIDVAYVASWIDCLFDKGIAFNGKLPDGSKPLSSMHGIFAPLAPTREELQTAPLTTQPGGTHHQLLQLWASNFKILNFSAIDANNSRTFWHAMDMKFQRFLKEYRELRIHCNERSHLGFCPGATHAGACLLYTSPSPRDS